MGMPLEIREHVYDELVLSPGADLINLLCVCKRVHAEAKKFLYKRPLTFESQSNFCTWMDVADPQLLKNVSKLKLKIVNVEPRDVQPYFTNNYGRSPFSPTGHSYKVQVERIIANFEMLPNIQELTICKSPEGQIPPCDVYEGVFGWMKENYPLRRLTFYIDKMPLTFLPPLHNLRYLCFTGFSVMNPDQALSLLLRLPLLTELALVGPTPGLTFHQRPGFRGKPIVQSITPYVMHQMLPLTSLCICEIADEYRDSPAFLTENFFWAILVGHSRKLQRLSINTNAKMGPSAEGALRTLLESTQTLKHLSIGWLDMDEGIRDALPPTLESIEVAVCSPFPVPDPASPHVLESYSQFKSLRPEVAVDILLRRAEEGSLPNLRTVVFKHSYQHGNTFRGQSDLQDSIWERFRILGLEIILRRLKEMGWKARWEVWYPCPCETRPSNFLTLFDWIVLVVAFKMIAKPNRKLSPYEDNSLILPIHRYEYCAFYHSAS